MKDTIRQLIQQALTQLVNEGVLPEGLTPAIQVENTRDKTHGDFASNIAMMLSKPAGMKPRDLAEKIIAALPADEIVTFAVRRTNLGQIEGEPNLLEVLSPDRYTFLPNTAGCYDAIEAVRTCRLARELLDGHKLVKLEVLADQKTLFPNVIETLKAAEILVKDGFDVMVYTSDDPIIARELEAMGCIAVMPLAGLIGTGLGICNPYNLRIILEEAKIPVLVDAGVGTASDATIAMEMGCEAVLMNSAIANAQHPIIMAEAMKHAIVAGRLAYLAGRMPKKLYASATSAAGWSSHSVGQLQCALLTHDFRQRSAATGSAPAVNCTNR